MKFKAILFLFSGVGLATLQLPAFAQSTGTRLEEDKLEEVVVSVERLPGTGLIRAEQTPKSRTTVSEKYLSTQAAGQTVIQSLNLVPGVNFTNADPYGSSGGNLRMRGFDGARISLMLDGVPLNDTGSYSIFTNQQIDPEVVEQVSVNSGTTDVDSPTASATGGTINLTMVKPNATPQVILEPSFGSDNYRRLFARGDTGSFGPWGTTSFLAISRTNYDKFKGPGDLEKTQVNARVYQSLNDDDFLSLSIHGNRNRNAFYRNLSLADIAAHGYNFDNDAQCVRPAAQAGTVQNESTTTCTNYFGLRDNPSDTANIRGEASIGLTQNLRWTFDPSFQYALANGGGYTLLAENDRRLIGSTTATGVDLNGDGDTRDTVGTYSPNNTNTHRYGIESSLLWTLNDANLLRLAYTLDYGRHRQTGQFGFLDADGNPENVFGGLKGTKVKSADGTDIRQRDRYSVARLNQVSLSYSTKLADDRVHLNLGVRAPFFTRELNQYCYTQVSNGAALCTSQTPSAPNANGLVTFAGNTNTFLLPFSGKRKYDDVLPNAGVSWTPWSKENQFYFSYAKGFSAPRTDNLYSVQILDVQPETTKSAELGYRYQADRTNASAVLWKSHYDNRIVTSFDPDLGVSVDRNVGAVELWGVDVSIGSEVVKGLSLYGTTSYNNSEIQKNVQFSRTVFVPTAGKELVETPDWTFGGRAEYAIGGFTFGLQGKYVDKRWATDVNDQAAPAYTVFDADLRYAFAAFGHSSFAQVNIINLTDKNYLGSVATSRFSATNPAFGSTVPLYSVGAPRTVQVSLSMTF